LEVLKDPINLIATLVHELSHIILLGEGGLEENDEELTDLNTIAMGFGIFTANSTFKFEYWRGTSHQVGERVDEVTYPNKYPPTV